MLHDSSPPAPMGGSAFSPGHADGARFDEPAPSHVERAWRFSLEPSGHEALLRCREVLGFGEAVLAAEDWRVPLPARLVLHMPDEAAAAWLERWAEDTEQVRRRLTVRRSDGVEVALIATIASFGAGVPTSLAVESIRLLDEMALHRSGVHSRAEVEAALARRHDLHEELRAD